MSERGERMLVFQLGSERFALRLAAVDEVIEMPSVQRLPDSSTNVLGVATLRGALVSIYDPRQLLRAGDGTFSATLLFSTGNRRVGLAIDDVFDPMVVDAREIREAPGTDAADGILQGVVRRGSELIAVLDVDALLRALSEDEDGTV